MARIIITGAGGTIGRILMRDLADLFPIGITRSAVDLTDVMGVIEMIEEHRPDVLIHCATKGGKQSFGEFIASDLIENISMVDNICRASANIGTIINIGSGAEYGRSGKISNVSERSLRSGIYPIPTDSYGLSKWLAWNQFEQMNNSVTLRLFGCFDPIEPDFRLLRRFADHAREGKHFVLSQDREFSWISGLDLSAVVRRTIELRTSRSWWKSKDLPRSLNVAYADTSRMRLSEFLVRWTAARGVDASFSIAQDGIGNPYTCDADLMMETLSPRLVGIDASMEGYE